MKKMLEGSRAIALAVKMSRPGVVSAYPITPQTHIVEDLAKFKADGDGSYQYIITESEFAAASVVLGASLGGTRVYTATSSQGLLLMAEVLFNIAGLRRPVVLTCANRAVGAPINIWNDQQDSLTVRDSGWIMLYAEDNQEAIDLHLQAFKIAEKLHLPVMINVDGFVLTHTYENIDLPSQKEVDGFLPKFKLIKDYYLDPKNPRSFGYFSTPGTYMEERQELFDDLRASQKEISLTAAEFGKKFKRPQGDGLVEYIGTGKEEVVLVAMGSVVGTMRVVRSPESGVRRKAEKFGILKIKSFRPFPDEEVAKCLKNAKYIAVVDKAVSLGAEGILAGEVRRAVFGRTKGKVQSFVCGLGGKDITTKVVENIVKEAQGKTSGVRFIYP
ncbi:MAG: pyruvate ferredoxin oxidoreductase [Patescibacteria group bacterium]|jgi:pyruvate ferredoxin oxidoreductase alpha subunit